MNVSCRTGPSTVCRAAVQLVVVVVVVVVVELVVFC